MNRIFDLINFRNMFLFWIFLLALAIIINIIKGGRTKGKAKDLVKDNDFILEKKGRIVEKMNNDSEAMKSAKNNTILSIVLLIICIILSFAINKAIISFIICGVSFVIFAINISKYNSISSEKYEETVKEILHQYDENLVYNPRLGFTWEEYKKCLFPERCDRFSSEDMIYNEKNSFYYSDILVESEYEDDDGSTHYSTEFAGSIAKMDIKSINCNIFLGTIHSRLLFRDDGLEKIKFENDDFNKLFGAYTDNELLAYKLLTPDVMEEFVNIKNNTYGDIYIRILNDKLYIRFNSGDTFDNVLFSNKAEQEALFKSIAVLEEVMKTMEKVKKIIDNKNMD